MKKIITGIVAIISCLGIQAQNHKKIFYKTQTVAAKDVQITIIDAVATPSVNKFKIILKNNTSDYIIYKPSESSFKIAGKTYNPEEKWLIIRPQDSESKVIDLKGKNYLIAADYEFIVDGLYKVSSDIKAIDAPEFKLPPSQNTFKAGVFNITLNKLKKETARTDVKFDINYTGNNIGIFEPNKVAMKMPDGKEYANYHADRNPLIISTDIVPITVSWKNIPPTSGNMQKTDMVILWRDSFKEGVLEKMPAKTLTILFDKALTQNQKK